MSDTFYDIHMHAFNMSHASLSAFLRRFPINSIPKMAWDAIVPKTLVAWLKLLGVVVVLAGVIAFFILVPKARPVVIVVLSLAILVWVIVTVVKILAKIKRFKNLLAIMDGNFWEYFLVMENCLREHSEHDEKVLLQNDGLHVGDEIYHRVVLTPLMMDFNYKGVADGEIHYWQKTDKPIGDQAADLLKSIRSYTTFNLTAKDRRFQNLQTDSSGQEPTRRILEIYPFLGINPQSRAPSNVNYDPAKPEEKVSVYTPETTIATLDKYFKNYSGSREDLPYNLANFKYTEEEVNNSPFIGVKLYPPLGFDPWPIHRKYKQDKNYPAVTKVIYDYCIRKNIPIVVHGSASGFVAVTDEEELKEDTRIDNWKDVLDYEENNLKKYAKLKLDIAHFPLDEGETSKRLKDIVDLMINYDNVYSDIACRAYNQKYYKRLKKYLSKKTVAEKKKLRERLLFGSDYPVVLPNVESYREYLRLFADSGTEKELMHLMCSVNPERFLFGKPE